MFLLAIYVNPFIFAIITLIVSGKLLNRLKYEAVTSF